MDDDFNTPNALAAIFDFIKEVNKKKISEKSASEIKKEFEKIDKVFGILKEKQEAPEEIKKMIKESELARMEKDFKKSDEIRDQIKEKGWIIEDSDSGPKLRKK